MKRFTAETFAKYRHPSSPLISPDGRLTAFVLTETDLEKNCYRADLWVLENETGTVRRLTAQGDAFSFAWTPDGRIVFAAPRGDVDPVLCHQPVGWRSPGAVYPAH